MIPIEEYIELSKTERQSHLDLTSSCIERGGPEKGGLSAYCKGLLAHILDTTIPSGHKIHVCHACNNANCSNPKHLYWGTAKENRNDTPQKTVWDRTVEKHGIEKARELFGGGNKANGGHAGKGRPKTEEQKKKISESMKGKKNRLGK